MDDVVQYLGWAVAIVGGVSTLWLALRRARRRAAAALARAGMVSDVLLGREAIIHPETGEVLVPETPGIGTRMAQLEKWQQEAGAILLKIADANVHITHLTRRMDEVSEKLDNHLQGRCPIGIDKCPVHDDGPTDLGMPEGPK